MAPFFDGQAEMELIRLAQSFSSPFWDSFFQLMTALGEEFFFYAAVTLFLWCLNKEFGYKLGFAFTSGLVVNFGLKELFHIPRPFWESGIRSLRTETAVGYSFPSGHTQNAATFWTSVMARCKKWPVYAAGAALIFLVGFSRLYLGVHTPTDVLGGLVIGVGWVFVSNLVFDQASRGKTAAFLFFVVPMLAGMFFFSGEYYFRASGGLAGIIGGYLIENRFIRYRVKAAIWKQAVKMAAGLSVLAAIRMFSKAVIPATPAGHFFRYFLIGLWVTAIAPYLFKLLLDREGPEPEITQNS